MKVFNSVEWVKVIILFFFYKIARQPGKIRVIYFELIVVEHYVKSISTKIKIITSLNHISWFNHTTFCVGLD